MLGVRLSGADDALAANDLAERPVEIAEALPVLLVDGEPGSEPLGGETDFLRAALAPAEDDAPAVRARVVKPADLSAESLKGARVVVLANVERLAPEQVAALTDFVAERRRPARRRPAIASTRRSMIKPCSPTAAASCPRSSARRRGNSPARSAVAHPSPRTFTGPALGPLGAGESAAMGEADLFAYRVLAPAARRLARVRHRPARHGRPLGRRAPVPQGPRDPARRPARRRGRHPAGQPRLRAACS